MEDVMRRSSAADAIADSAPDAAAARKRELVTKEITAPAGSMERGRRADAAALTPPAARLESRANAPASKHTYFGSVSKHAEIFFARPET